MNARELLQQHQPTDVLDTGVGRLQPVLMRPTPQLSLKTWGGGGGVPARDRGGGSGRGVRGASSQG